MNPVDALSRYLDLALKRLRYGVWFTGITIVATTTLILTVALAWLPASLLWERIALVAGMAVAGIFAIAIPLTHLNISVAARRLEQKFPAFSQQLMTFLDKHDDPFRPLIAEAALEVARHSEPAQLFPARRLAVASMLTLLALAMIVFMRGREAAFTIEVKAPRRTIRRGGDLPVTAHISGFDAHNANLWFREAGFWRSMPMLPTAKDAIFALQLSGLTRNIEYYAESQGIRSSVSSLKVVDLPAVTGINISYPGTSALRGATDGNILAPAGTIAELEIMTDRPMNNAELILDEAATIALTPARENRISTHLRVLRNDSYHVSMKYEGEEIPVSGEHTIEVMITEEVRKKAPSLTEGHRVGPVPYGYEKSVDEYYRRLSEQRVPGH